MMAVAEFTYRGILWTVDVYDENDEAEMGGQVQNIEFITDYILEREGWSGGDVVEQAPLPELKPEPDQSADYKVALKNDQGVVFTLDENPHEKDAQGFYKRCSNRIRVYQDWTKDKSKRIVKVQFFHPKLTSAFKTSAAFAVVKALAVKQGLSEEEVLAKYSYLDASNLLEETLVDVAWHLYLVDSDRRSEHGTHYKNIAQIVDLNA